MKVPYTWLREYVADAPAPAVVAGRLAMVGTEVERIATFGVPDAANGGSEGYRVGRVASFEQHPNADRLRLCRVDVGEGETRQIVCGASNFREGDTVAVVLPGATLPGGQKLGTAKLRGVESFGMMLSERELELSSDHGGIMILPSDWQPGEPLGKRVPIGDSVLELEVTPNRPDCLGVAGVAREVAAAFDLSFDDIAGDDPQAQAPGHVDDHVGVRLEAPDLCPRYMARAFVDVRVGTSPHWLRARLAAAGMRSINNVVDVTNYVMLATGQPLHAFDADRLDGGTIVVRRAHAQERVTTLDDVERTLGSDMLSIADASRTAVIAGIMGAADVEVGEQTTTVVLEAACFAGRSIMETSHQLGLRTESSQRFEKGLDPYLPEVALRMASRLLVELCGARMVPGTIDCVAGGRLPELPQVELPADLPSRVLGADVPAADVERILLLLGYTCAPRSDGEPGWAVTVPHWRMYDTTRPIDLVEEIGRIFGLDRVPATMPARRSAVGALTAPQRLQRLVEDAAAGLGLHEAITYTLVGPGHNERFGADASQVVRLSNPMTEEHSELRTGMVGSLLEVVRHNQAAGIDDVALFEVSRTFRSLPEGRGATGADAAGSLPVYAVERPVLAVCCTGTLWGQALGSTGVPADFAAIAGIVEAIVATAGAQARMRPLAADEAFLHPGQAAAIVVGEDVIGWAGMVHPAVARDFAIRGDVVAAELDLALLGAVVPDLHLHAPMSTFPPVRQDIAVVVDAAVLAGDVLETVRQTAGGLLEHVEVFDRYAGAPIAEGRYSLALRLVFRAEDRTLTDDEVAGLREQLVSALESRHGAELRAGG